jgi:hypothetical protein
MTHAILEFIDWYCSEPRLAFNKTVVTRYRICLSKLNTHRQRSTCGSRLCGVLRTRPLTLGCSAQISRPEYDGSRVRRSMESEWAIGLQQNRVGVFYAPSISQHPAASETMQQLPSSLWLIQADSQGLIGAHRESIVRVTTILQSLLMQQLLWARWQESLNFALMSRISPLLLMHFLTSRIDKLGQHLRMDVAAGQNGCKTLAQKFMMADCG